jgi:hypothetical protein
MDIFFHIFRSSLDYTKLDCHVWTNFFLQLDVSLYSECQVTLICVLVFTLYNISKKLKIIYSIVFLSTIA